MRVNGWEVCRRERGDYTMLSSKLTSTVKPGDTAVVVLERARRAERSVNFIVMDLLRGWSKYSIYETFLYKDWKC